MSHYKETFFKASIPACRSKPVKINSIILIVSSIIITKPNSFPSKVPPADVGRAAGLPEAPRGVALSAAEAAAGAGHP